MSIVKIQKKNLIIQVLLLFLVIVGATHTEQLQSNMQCLDIEIDEKLAKKLDEISEPFMYGKPFASYRLS
ncbi:hypothetical protein [Paenibacillus faecalis]|uniref:hypothetical protein n=1 Tax=Paenibacillus faecalis TaxID=2079532 RepID=UPI000D0E6C5F|nr:hypothetical protein [Paenibacillus faecalis]